MKMLCVGVITPESTWIERHVTTPVESYVFVRKGTADAAFREVAK